MDYQEKTKKINELVNYVSMLKSNRYKLILCLMPMIAFNILLRTFPGVLPDDVTSHFIWLTAVTIEVVAPIGLLFFIFSQFRITKANAKIKKLQEGKIE